MCQLLNDKCFDLTNKALDKIIHNKSFGYTFNSQSALKTFLKTELTSTLGKLMNCTVGIIVTLSRYEQYASAAINVHNSKGEIITVAYFRFNTEYNNKDDFLIVITCDECKKMSELIKERMFRFVSNIDESEVPSPVYYSFREEDKGDISYEFQGD